MKKTSLFLSLLFLPISIFGQKEMEDDSKQISVIPISIRSIIQNSDTVRWMLIDPIFNQEDSSIVVLKSHGEILDEKVDTMVDRKIKLIATLVSPYSFEKDSVVKNCIFMPDIAIEFVKNDSISIVSYSFYCDVCRFSQGDEYYDFNGESVREELLQMAMELFPKDRYLRKISNK